MAPPVRGLVRPGYLSCYPVTTPPLEAAPQAARLAVERVLLDGHRKRFLVGQCERLVDLARRQAADVVVEDRSIARHRNVVEPDRLGGGRRAAIGASQAVPLR